jgi:photosystem II stability/assembly factor-like uncharacterized protein
LKGVPLAWVVARPGAATVLTTVYNTSDGSSRLWASQDHGLTWSLVLGIPSAARPSIDRSDASRIVVAGPNDSLWHSLDSGVSWQPIGRIPVGSGSTLTSDYPSIYASTYAGNRYRLFRSTDEGASWADVTPPEIPISITAYAVGDGAIYAGAPSHFCRSTDAAATWTCSSFPQYPTKIVETRGTGGQSVPRLIVLSFDHAYVSDDLGATWSTTAELSTSAGSASVAAGPSGSIALLGTPRGILRSADGGLSWARAGAGLRASSVQSLTADPHDPSTLWIDTGFYGDSDGDLFRSSDAGDTWSPGNGPPASVLPPHPRRGPVRFIHALRRLAVALPLRDAGGTWTMLSSLPGTYVQTVAADPVTGTVWAASSAGLFESSDRGETWSGPEVSREVYSLLVDANGTGATYAGSYFDIDTGFYAYPFGGALFFSPGAGDGFVRESHDFGSFVTAIAADPFDEQRLYVGAYNGIFSSADAGATWSGPAPESTRFGRVNSLVADPVRAGHIYAATDTGVYRSTDHAESWQAFSAGLGFLAANALVISPDGRTLRVGTNGGGVFELDLEGAVPFLPCEETSNRLCLVGRRYAVELFASRSDAGESQPASAWPLGDRAGYFGFGFATGDASLPEVVVKILGEGAFGTPGARIFYTSLTTLPWTLTVTDTVTGLSETFQNDPAAPLLRGRGPIVRVRRYGHGAPAGRPDIRPGVPPPAQRAILGHAHRHRASGDELAVKAVPETDRFGYFSFPGAVGDPTFPEVVVKMIDYRLITGKFWVFQAGLTSFEYTLTITDTETEESRTYEGNTPFCGRRIRRIPVTAGALGLRQHSALIHGARKARCPLGRSSHEWSRRRDSYGVRSLLLALALVAPATGAAAQAYGLGDQVLTVGSAAFQPTPLILRRQQASLRRLLYGQIEYVAPLTLPDGAEIFQCACTDMSRLEAPCTPRSS